MNLKKSFFLKLSLFIKDKMLYSKKQILVAMIIGKGPLSVVIFFSRIRSFFSFLYLPEIVYKYLK